MKLEKTTYKSTHERLEAEGFSPEQQLEVRSRIRIIYFPLPPIGVFGFFVSLRIEMQLEMDLMAGISCRVAGEKPGGIFCPSKKIVFLCIRINAL